MIFMYLSYRAMALRDFSILYLMSIRKYLSEFDELLCHRIVHGKDIFILYIFLMKIATFNNGTNSI